MSSLIRRIERKWAKSRADYEPRPQQYKMLRDGGYLVLHPTKGWRRVCGARLRAGRRMAALLGS